MRRMQTDGVVASEAAARDFERGSGDDGRADEDEDEDEDDTEDAVEEEDAAGA